MNIKFATVLAVVVALLSGWLLVTVAGSMPTDAEIAPDMPAPADNAAPESDGAIEAAVDIQEPTVASVEVD